MQLGTLNSSFLLSPPMFSEAYGSQALSWIYGYMCRKHNTHKTEIPQRCFQACWRYIKIKHMTSLPGIIQIGCGTLREDAANIANKIVVDFDKRTLIFPIFLFYRHQIHQFEHYLPVSAIRRRPGRLCRQDLQSSCIKHSVCKTDFHSCFFSPKNRHTARVRGEQSARSFNKPTSPPLEH